MATFIVKTAQSFTINGEFIDKGLSVQVSSLFPSPFSEPEKIHKAFMRIHGLDLKSSGYLIQGYLSFEVL
ncbi:DUF6140 family protein [Aureivirga sp. CE67]|uniref:DUF6140 family protein n=1 Tax=Aureivirga sp. CE67 TaxID=1788983 RepID=UPI0018CAF3E5|nr:DUF6140 family protein [Aureivirga sp. CE67]